MASIEDLTNTDRHFRLLAVGCRFSVLPTHVPYYFASTKSNLVQKRHANSNLCGLAFTCSRVTRVAVGVLATAERRDHETRSVTWQAACFARPRNDTVCLFTSDQCLIIMLIAEVGVTVVSAKPHGARSERRS